MNNKQLQTLIAIFTVPVPTDIKWKDIINLLDAFGRTISQGKGSRVRILLNGIKAVFHELHPRKETDRGAVVSIREFLEKAGINPEHYKGGSP
jgi:HicA toxin of bacterial toxin-antitoxin,